jgi:hypothetical protein
MKRHVELFEEFLNLNSNAEESGLASRFATSSTVNDIMRNKTHSVSKLVSDEHGTRTEIVSKEFPATDVVTVAIDTKDC